MNLNHALSMTILRYFTTRIASWTLFWRFRHLFQPGFIKNYIEKDVADYMKQANLEITIEINSGNKSFTCYTMDFTQKYISINSDYRS